MLQRAGEDERQPRERRVDRLALGTAVALEIHTGGAQPLHQAPVAINREPRADALRDRGTDSVDRGELLLVPAHDRVQVGERASERLGGGRADVVDAEPDEHAPQRLSL